MRIVPARGLLPGLLLLAVLAFLASLLAGPAGLGTARTLAALLGHGDAVASQILHSLRLPRSLSAFAVGSQLALAGVLLQALFRNPLADPYVMGVSGGASVGALAGMLLGLPLAGLQWSATGGALAAGAAVMFLAAGRDTLRLLLTGVVLASACGALATVLLALADEGQLRGMVFWLAGDLGWAPRPALDLLVSAVALVLAWAAARPLDVLAAGELRSASLGVDPRRARPWVFVAAALLAANAVLAAGPIGFIGLLAPHLARLALGGSAHRAVVPAAALLGGTLLCLADLASRLLAAPRQLPVGAVTALLGAPVFLALLRGRRGAG